MDKCNHVNFSSNNIFTTAMESNYQGYLFQIEIRDKWRQTMLDLPSHKSPLLSNLCISKIPQVSVAGSLLTTAVSIPSVQHAACIQKEHADNQSLNYKGRKCRKKMHSEPNIHQNTPRSLKTSFHPSFKHNYFKGTLIELKEKEKQFPSSSV